MSAAQDRANEVVRDLREQNLLPVVALLIVLIIAVPMMLKSGGAEAPPPTELAVGLKPMLETKPVVLASTPELRDFRTRLDTFEKKNPFHQPKPVVTKAATSAIDSAAADSQPTLGGTSTDTAASTDTGSSSGATATDLPPAGSTDAPVTDPTGGSGSSGSSGGDTGSSGTEVISYDIDVEIGKAGAERTLSGVKIGTLLPSNDHPIVQFVSTDMQGTFASFVVSPNVSGADGDGNCSPSRSACQFLKLSVGDGEKLFYAPNGETYRLKLTAITRRVDPLKKLSSAAQDVTQPIDNAVQWRTG